MQISNTKLTASAKSGQFLAVDAAGVPAEALASVSLGSFALSFERRPPDGGRGSLPDVMSHTNHSMARQLTFNRVVGHAHVDF